MAVRSGVLLAGLLLCRCHALIVIYGNSTTTTEIAAYSANRWLGVTFENAAGPQAEVRGVVHRFDGDYCEGAGIPKEAVNQRVVLLPQSSWTCPDFVIYDNFADLNASAIIREVPYGAGWRYTMPSISDHTGRQRHQHAIMVEARFTTDLGLSTATSAATVLREGDVVLVRADKSPYIVVFETVWYQILGRWLLVGLYAALAVLALRYLWDHALLIRFAPNGNRRPCRDLAGHITLIHAALFAGLLKAVTMAVMYVGGGFGAISTLPYEVTMIMSSHFMGLENSISIITARYWHKITLKSDITQQHGSYLLGDCIIGLFAFSAVLLDVAEITQLIMYRQSVAGVELYQLNALVNGICVFAIAIYFSVSIALFRIGLMRSRRAREGSSVSVRMDNFLRRFVTLAILLTLSMFMFLTQVAIFSTNPYMNDNPVGFAIYAVTYNITLPAMSLFSILMLKPRRPGERISQSTQQRRISIMPRLSNAMKRFILSPRNRDKVAPVPPALGIVAES